MLFGLVTLWPRLKQSRRHVGPQSDLIPLRGPGRLGDDQQVTGIVAVVVRKGAQPPVADATAIVHDLALGATAAVVADATGLFMAGSVLSNDIELGHLALAEVLVVTVPEVVR
jgi:hypothetical protein